MLYRVVRFEKGGCPSYQSPQCDIISTRDGDIACA
jgi:hypothetical protein